MHTSIRLETPCEFINVTPLNPLISKCQIKVCYVSDEPNRNKSIITKEVARSMANSLPGSPIVGYYNEATGDFEEHNRTIDISNGKFTIKDSTRPYGFVDLGAKVWFQKFLDDGEVEREYLMTEGYLWTGQYPEAQRIIDEGNNQSMELDDKFLDAYWTKDNKGKPQFFIINEAIISKLCVLGEDCEPCFEGSNITSPQITFSFEDSFKEQLFSMMNQIKEILNEGGAPVFNTYAVEIGDSLWNALYSYLEKSFPQTLEDGYVCGSTYRIEGIYEEGGQKFAILQNRANSKYFRMNFALDESTGFAASAELVEVTKTYVPLAQPQFALADVENFETEYAKKKKEEKEEEEKNKKDAGKEPGDEGKSEGKEDKPEDKKEEGSEEDPEDDDEEEKKKKKKTKFAKDDKEDDEEICPKCGKPVSECECDKDDDEEKNKKDQGKKAKYNLDEIQEYTELQQRYSELETNYNNLVSEHQTLQEQVTSLTEFKNSMERKDKEAMINSFYMLSDEDKKDCVENIDKYSLDDIEAKLSIICVRNKVNFNLDEDKNEQTDPTTYNLNGANISDESTPAWVKSLRSVAKNMK